MLRRKCSHVAVFAPVQTNPGDRAITGTCDDQRALFRASLISAASVARAICAA